MGLDHNIPGITLLDEEEKQGLLIRTIDTREDLNEFEMKNVEEALLWVLRRSFVYTQVLDELFIYQMHQKMFGKVWAWAGKARTTNKNLGVDKFQIPVLLKSLVEDTRYWIENDTYEPDELALRFKHRLVGIHCFPDGNGRHGRMMADIIIHKIFDRDFFSWGRQNLSKHITSRKRYLDAMKAGDHFDFLPLIKFARS